MVNTGIIGIGNMGSAHLRCIYSGEIKYLKVVSICDVNKEKLEKLKKEYPDLRCYYSADEMYEKEKLDAVIIATPHKFHAELAIKALEHGINVLSEKPVDITVSMAEMLNQTAKKSGKIFAVMFNQRTNELFQKAREIVKSGSLGELKRTSWIITNWYRTQHYYDSAGWRATWSGEGGGVLLNQAPHNLDLWQWICGMPESITAFCDVAKYHRIEVEDDVSIYCRYKNGATGTFITSTGEYPGTNRLEIAGDMGKIVLENGTLKWWKLKESEKKVRFSSDVNFAQIEYDYTEIKQSEKESGHRGILQNFANAVSDGEALIAPGVEGINELSLSNAAYLSQWMGNKAVKLPFDQTVFDNFMKEKMNESKIKKEQSVSSTENEYQKRWQVQW